MYVTESNLDPNELEALFGDSQEIPTMTVELPPEEASTPLTAFSSSIAPPTEEEQRALANSITDGNTFDTVEEEDLQLDLDLDSSSSSSPKWSNSNLTKIGIVAFVFIVFGFFGAGFLSLFSGSSQSQVAQNTTEADSSEAVDPTAQAIQEAENSKAQLILLGDPVDNPQSSSSPVTPSNQPSESSSSPVSSASQTVTVPSRSYNPPPQTVTVSSRSYNPPPPQPVAVSPRSYSSTYIPPQRVSVPPPPRSFNTGNTGNTGSSVAAVTPKIDREAIKKRGWSGYSQDQQSSSQKTPENQPSSVVATASSEIPTVRLGESSSPSENWINQRDISTIPSSNPQSSAILASNGINLRYLEKNPLPQSRQPIVLPIGTQLSAKLQSPIIYVANSQRSNNPNNQPFNQPFTVTLTEAISDQRGLPLLPAGTLMLGRVLSVSPSGMVSAEITAITYNLGGKQHSRAIPSGQILLLGSDSQPLRAKRLNDPSGAIARQDILLGTLGAAATGLEYANRPDTQTTIQQSGVGFSSSSTTNNQDVNLPAGLAEGFFNSINGQVQARSQAAINEYQSQTPEFVVPVNTSVSLFLNANLEINQ